MADLLSQLVANPPPSLVGPDYNIYRYTDQIYKIVHFKAPRICGLLSNIPSKKKEPSEKKPDSSLSRARRIVLELALCNDWKYFCTFTLDKKKYDRFNLEVWKKDFTQWLRDQRKKYRKYGYEFDCPFLFVPELHQDGAWHMHGLMGDVSRCLIPFYCERKQGLSVPDLLVHGGYFDWPDYRSKFGYCSFGKVQSKVATAFYISKYISKDLQSTCDTLGTHSYIPSRGLQRASLHGSVYGTCEYLNQYLVNHYEFVDTGMTSVNHDLDWTFGLEYMSMSSLGVQPMEIFGVDQLHEDEIAQLECYFESLCGVQSVLEDFECSDISP